MKKSYSIIFVLVLLASLGFSREVTVPAMQNGGAMDGLPQTILADSTDRNAALPEQTTYVLDNGGTYPIVTLMEIIGYKLHIRTADLNGEKARLVPAPREDGGYNDFFTFRSDGLLENLIIEAMRTLEPYAASRHNIEIRNSSTLTVKSCEIAHDTPGSAFSVWEEDPEDRNSLIIEDCLVHSIGHYASLGGNGRLLGVRSNMDTLSVVNTTFFNLTDRLFRHGSTGWDVQYVKVDHCTGMTVSGYHGYVQLGAAHEVVVTNNIFFNPIAFGSHSNRVEGGNANEQSQPESDKMHVVTLDTIFADSDVTVANNNIYWEQQYKDLWAAHSDVTTAPGVITPTIAGANNSSTPYFAEELTFVAPPPSTYEYHAAGLADPNATTFPNNFYFGLATDIDVSYGTDAASYTAAAGGFPVGNLNAYPDKKAEWDAAGRPIVEDGLPDITDLDVFYFRGSNDDYPWEGGAAGQGSPNGERLMYLFDNDVETKFLVRAEASWIDVYTNTLSNITSYTITSANDVPERDPKTWDLQGWDAAASAWVTIHSVVDNPSWPDFFTPKTWEFENDKSFSTYRLDIKSINGDAQSLMQISEFELNGELGDVVDVVTSDGPIADITDLEGMEFVGSNDAYPWEGGSAGQGSPDGEKLLYLFDNDVETKYLVRAVSSWIDVYTPKLSMVKGYTITSANDAPTRDPKDWEFQGLNTETGVWETIHAVTANPSWPDFFTPKTWSFSNSTWYSSYRLNILDINDDPQTLMQISEFSIAGFIGDDVDLQYPPTAIDDDNKNILTYSLSQNYPNPFNPSTTINYTIPKVSDVTVTVYNTLGQKVKTLVNTKQNAGKYTLNFNAGELASGIYFYQIKAGKFTKVNKMLFVK